MPEVGFRPGQPGPKSALTAATLHMPLSTWLCVSLPVRCGLLGKDRGIVGVLGLCIAAAHPSVCSSTGVQ